MDLIEPVLCFGSRSVFLYHEVNWVEIQKEASLLTGIMWFTALILKA